MTQLRPWRHCRRIQSSLLVVLLIFLADNNNSVSANPGGGGTLLKKPLEQQRSNKAWNAWSKQRWTNRSPFLIVPKETSETAADSHAAGTNAKTSSTCTSGGWKLVMPTTASEEWEFYSTLPPSKSSLKPKASDKIGAELLLLDVQKKRRHPSVLSNQNTDTHIPSNTNSVIPTWQRRFLEDYNFKGFGISLYKSFMKFKSAGIAFRVPVLGNWDRWDRNPALPSVNAMVCLYYPLNISVCLTSSMRVEPLKWACQQLVQAGQNALRRVWQEVVRTMYILVSIFFFPIHGKWLEPPNKSQHTQATTLSRSLKSKSSSLKSVQYKKDIQERLGMSMYYGWSPSRGGFYTRASYWHLYLPTLALCQQALERVLPASQKEDAPSTSSSSWLAKHFASLGADTSLPNPMPPRFFVTAVMSFSGLYFDNLRSMAKKVLPTSRQARKPVATAPGTFISRHSIPMSVVQFLLEDEPSTTAGHTNKRYRAMTRGMPPIARGGEIVILPEAANQ